MRYFLAFLIPPLAVLLCKRPGQFVVNLLIWLVSIPAIAFLGLGLIGWLICTIHALSVCKASSVDKRINRVVAAIEARNAPAESAKL
jgi:uncharacterized membrane protein YqaE (UPF0057 family)